MGAELTDDEVVACTSVMKAMVMMTMRSCELRYVCFRQADESREQKVLLSLKW